jgi:hypothetical protein
MHSRAEVLEVLLQNDLYEAGWNGSDTFYPGISTRQAAMGSLAKSFMKKFHNDETDDSRDSAALMLFKECNERCRTFDGVSPQKLDEEYVIGEMKSILYDFFNPVTHDSTREPLLLNLSDIANYFGLGAGSNIGISSTDFYSKYVTSTMSHTDPSLPIFFRHAISVDKLWTDVEAFRSKRFGYEVVSGNRLSFVPKSKEISRTICTEPLLNMFFQKGIGGVMQERLREVFNIDFTIQPERNATLARIGSETGKFGTIDLSSASDSISLRLLEDILPREPLNWLLRTRSPETVLPDGSVLKLHMVSSMGNGYTFPLQTTIFAALVLAAYKIYGIKPIRPWKLNPGNYAVFGDDIICDYRVYSVVCRCLSILGFKVNEHKSFNEGLFRESCGKDYFLGTNIRGVYIKTLRDDMDSYSAINRLIRWSTEHGILLRRAVGYLRAGCRFIGVPYDEADNAGIKIPVSLLRKPRRDSNGAIHYLACVVSPRRVRIPSCDADAPEPDLATGRDRVSLPGFVYSSDGVLLCLLAGHLRDGFIGLRLVRRKAVLRRRKTACWDGSFYHSSSQILSLLKHPKPGQTRDYGLQSVPHDENRENERRWKATVIASLVG